MVEISTSILSVKKGQESETFFALEKAKTNYLHIDVMDGKFVENNTYEKMREYASYIKRISNLPLDIHLMVDDVKEAIDDFLAVEPNIITFHLEACKNKQEVMELINYIKQNNCKVGIAIKPNTKIEEIYEYLPFIHTVLVMTVEPGFGGQKFMEDQMEKVKELVKLREENNYKYDIEVDGGVNPETIKTCFASGANVIVAGSAVLGAKDISARVEEFAQIAKEYNI